MAGMSRGEKEMDIRKLRLDRLAAAATGNDKWLRTQARQIMVEQPSEAIQKALEFTFSGNGTADKRREAFACLLASNLIDFSQRRLEKHSIDGREFEVWIEEGGLIEQAMNDPEPGIRLWAARAAQALQIVVRKEDSVDSGPHPSLLRMALDEDASIRFMALMGQHRNITGSWTNSRNPALVHTGDGKPLWKIIEANARAVTELAGLVMRKDQNADSTLRFALWQAIEPHIGGAPQFILPWLADLAPKTKPLSEILTYKTARRITDTRSAENMDLLLAFLDKIKDDDVLTARALDGMLKAQEAGALKPAKADPAPLLAHWKASKDGNVRNLSGRLATLWGDESAVAELIKLAEDEKAPADQRAEAIRTLRKSKSPAARAALLRLLEKSSGQ